MEAEVPDEGSLLVISFPPPGVTPVSDQVPGSGHRILISTQHPGLYLRKEGNCIDMMVPQPEELTFPGSQWPWVVRDPGMSWTRTNGLHNPGVVSGNCGGSVSSHSVEKRPEKERLSGPASQQVSAALLTNRSVHWAPGHLAFVLSSNSELIPSCNYEPSTPQTYSLAQFSDLFTVSSLWQHDAPDSKLTPELTITVLPEFSEVSLSL